MCVELLGMSWERLEGSELRFGLVFGNDLGTRIFSSAGFLGAPDFSPARVLPGNANFLVSMT